MQSKYEYRSYFADVMIYVKMSNILRDLGLSTSNFYKFMKADYYDHYMSIELLDKINERVHQVFEELT